MSGRRRGALAILAVLAVAMLIAWVTTRLPGSPLPAGSSRSYRPDGLQALYLWAEATGGHVTRFDASPVGVSPAPGAPPSGPDAAAGTMPGDLWLVVQPAFLSVTERQRLDRIAQEGGTLVIAGDSIATRSLLALLGFTLVPTPIYAQAKTNDSGAAAPLALSVRNRLEGTATADATPLLLNAEGGWVALRKPYLNGTLVVMATPYLLTNEGLQDAETARFVYRELLAPVLTAGAAGTAGRVTFDESLRAAPAVDVAGSPVTLRQLVLGTPPGWAVLFAVAVTLVCLALRGRRFGPALPPVEASTAPRTMAEHIQAIAGLYRRARLFDAVRRHFGERFRRAGVPAPVVAQIEGAASESALLAAVTRAHEAAPHEMARRQTVQSAPIHG